MKRLPRSFFEEPTLKVAPGLLGKVLVFEDFQGLITETEAYIGQEDPACHAARGKTPRNEIMFGKAGLSYVYFIYGMYFCLNIVTEHEGFPAAVLLRALWLFSPVFCVLDGPGKLCRYLGLSKAHNALDLVESPHFYVGSLKSAPVFSLKMLPRVGIKVGTDKLWRFKAEFRQCIRCQNKQAVNRFVCDPCQSKLIRNPPLETGALSSFDPFRKGGIRFSEG
jgi:DNA-3-methyladenine glycosylase